MIQYILLDFFIIMTLALKLPAEPEIVRAERPEYDCKECHSELLEHEMMHYPAEDDCTTCHEATGASHPSSDSVGFRLMDQLPALCFYCHEENQDKAHTHKPVGEGNCLGCHDTHGSSGLYLLNYSDPDLCLSCHRKMRGLVQGKMKAHSAIEGGGCMSCHLSHGSENRALLVDYYPEEDYVPALKENFELCFLCHDTDLLVAEETEWGTGFRDGKKNLHWIHMNGNKGRNCRMCHNIHGSSQEFLVEESVAFGKWEMQMNFIPEELGGSCLPGCHGKQSYRR